MQCMADSQTPISRRLLALLASLLLVMTGASLPSGSARAAGTGDTLTVGQQLDAGDQLRSPAGRYRLSMQSDGNAVLYADAARVLWASRTVGNPGARLVMQSDGNLVLYSAAGKALWASRTSGAGARLALQDDGNLVVYVGGVARWASGVDPGPASITAPTTLSPGQQLRSANQAYRLVMQRDGNLVAYAGGSARWSSRTAGNVGARLVLQSDGNLVVYSTGNAVLWTAASRGGTRLSLQDDGNLVLYRADNSAAWNRWLRFASSSRALTAAERTAMTGVTWRAGCPTGLAQLRHVSLVYWDFAGQPQQGALVVRSDAVSDVVAVFGKLYAAHYPIRRMVPIEAYRGDDDASMAADNTSAFNCRNVAGGSGWSRHAYGVAIDINPLENPYISGGVVSPPAGAAYVNRNQSHPAILRSNSVAVREFIARGWQWGGNWTNPKDYQHVDFAP